MLFKTYNPKELREFDGNSDNGRILMAVNGSVYDVTRGRNFYGPGMFQSDLLLSQHQTADMTIA